MIVWFRLVGFLGVWVMLLLIYDVELTINWAAVKKLPEVVTLYVVLSYISTKWLWRLPIFRGWLVPFPDLEGTWRGEIKSTWKDPQSGKLPPPIPAILVIKHTFSSISCSLHTQESDSYSTAAQITRDDDSGVIRLSYNYANRPRATIRSRSTIHDGAATLIVTCRPKRMLKGEYWTSRKTTGDISLTFETRKRQESFSEH